MGGIPGTTIAPCTTDGWADPDGNVVWTGFYGDKDVAAPRAYSLGGSYVPPTSIGARVLGQEVDDRFGNAVGSDGRWLYIAAPAHTALQTDVPFLTADRNQSGVVYQLRTLAKPPSGGINLAQLWMEPGQSWPNIDVEIPSRTDYTMPVPHQYIIEIVGSIRGNYQQTVVDWSSLGDCPGKSAAGWAELLNKAWVTTEPLTFTVSDADQVGGYKPYPTDSAGYYTDITPQIVGPHDTAKISYVRGLGDVDGDGVRDFAVGSPNVKQTMIGGSGVTFTGPEVGSIFIVYGRATGLEGDYLLENLAADPGAPGRLRGVLLQGTSSGENLARVFDNAGDFNGDGYADVIVGNEAYNGDTGEVIVILGQVNLESPAGGWTVGGIVSTGKAIRFEGAATGDLVGANVAGAGDVDGDGFSDILIAASGAESGKGAVYLIYGSDLLAGSLNLSLIGTADLPGAKFIGRQAGDQLGGGIKIVTGTDPGQPSASFDAYSRGVASLGDIDGDGKDDYAISAILADPQSRTDSGEVYVIYGAGD
jgi:hypothetical protein